MYCIKTVYDNVWAHWNLWVVICEQKLNSIGVFAKMWRPHFTVYTMGRLSSVRRERAIGMLQSGRSLRVLPVTFQVSPSTAARICALGMFYLLWEHSVWRAQTQGTFIPLLKCCLIWCSQATYIGLISFQLSVTCQYVLIYQVCNSFTVQYLQPTLAMASLTSVLQ